MKKLIYTLAIAFAGMMTLTACGGGKVGEFTVDSEMAEKVRGDYDLDESIQIEQGTYPIKLKDGILSFSVDLKVVEEIDKKNLSNCVVDEFEAEVYDKDNNSIYINDDGVDEFKAENAAELLNNIINASVGDKITATYSYAKGSEDDLKLIASQIKAIKIRLRVDEKEDIVDAYTSDEDEGEEINIASSGSEDWDQILNDYEKYVDSYINLYKKAMNGDMNAMSEYASTLEKAEQFSSKLEKANGNMSSAQMARYTRITNKMAKAAM